MADLLTPPTTKQKLSLKHHVLCKSMAHLQTTTSFMRRLAIVTGNTKISIDKCCWYSNNALLERRCNKRKISLWGNNRIKVSSLVVTRLKISLHIKLLYRRSNLWKFFKNGKTENVNTTCL